jgi:hypothetical protein
MPHLWGQEAQNEYLKKYQMMLYLYWVHYTKM